MMEGKAEPCLERDEAFLLRDKQLSQLFVGRAKRLFACLFYKTWPGQQNLHFGKSAGYRITNRLARNNPKVAAWISRARRAWFEVPEARCLEGEYDVRHGVAGDGATLQSHRGFGS